MRRQCTVLVLVVAILAVLPVTLPSQSENDRAELALRGRCSVRLERFAAMALHQQVGTRARAAYDEILRHYDVDHAVARQALGYRQTRAGWKAPRRPQPVVDRATDEQRRRVLAAWHALCKKLAAQHRQRGLAIVEAQPVRGRAHLRRAIEFDPFDRVAHDRLGHGAVVIAGQTYRGSAAQIDFIRSMRRLERVALGLARRRDFPVDDVTVLPEELVAMGATFHGIRSEHFTVFARGPRADAVATVRWAERALVFLRHCLGEAAARRLQVVAKQRRYWDWQAFVWTEHELRRLLDANLRRHGESALAEHLRGAEAQMARTRFGNVQWFDGERCREVVQSLTPAAMHDRVISSCWEIGLGLDVRLVENVKTPKGPKNPKNPKSSADSQPAYAPNWALTEGVLHAATWLLKSTAITQRGSMAEGTAAGTQIQLPKSVNWWVRTMRDHAIARTDMPVREVARQRSSSFPNAARLKAWSFMTFLMARYPAKWHDFVLAVPGDKVPFPSEVDQAAEQVFGRALADIEAEWRGWASGQSIIAIAMGIGLPALAATPTREQAAGLRRLNEYRAQAGLLPCVLDQEATLACIEHARYLARHPEHQLWPAVHEQDPAKVGFTARGMRCGMRSVIVIDARGASRSVDGWMGTIYHRLPLLSQNIRRVGFALEQGMCVLDVGSLEEPPAVDRRGQPKALDWILWPPDGAEKVGRQFAFYELPNPLGDQPAPNDRDDQAGYPISLTMPEHVHRDLRDADIHLYEVKRRGSKLVRRGEVRLHVHTPREPLLARNQTLDTVFGIPFRPLAKRTTYQAVVTLRRTAGTTKVEWCFTTGSVGLRRPPKSP